jgi:hypothetical protein
MGLSAKRNNQWDETLLAKEKIISVKHHKKPVTYR